MDEMKKVLHLRQMDIGALVKKISASGSKRDFMELPETAEIWNRTPKSLRMYLAYILRELREPWRLHCQPSGGRRDDLAYFSMWTRSRDKNFPELRPGYRPPKKKDDDDDDGDGADDGSPLPPGL